MKPQEPFHGPTVCALTGISFRQLDYWDRTGLARPSIREAKGSGSQRLYSVDDLVLLRLIRRLSDGGLSLQWIRGWARELRAAAESGGVVIVDGQRVHRTNDLSMVLHILETGLGVFAISVDRVRAEIESKVNVKVAA